MTQHCTAWIPALVATGSDIDELLDPVKIDAAADRGCRAWWCHAGQFRACRQRVANDTTVGIEPAAVDDRGALSQSVADRASAPTRAPACARVRLCARSRKNSSLRGTTLRAALVETPTLRAQE
jgi:hypothetical protein